ncbi:MAG: M28 family peptidase [Cyclobacteriaceae bacterium]
MKFSILTSIILICILPSCSQTSDLTSVTSAYFDLVRPEFTGDVAFETTAFVEQFWRVAGNTGFNESVYRIASKLEKAGYVLEENASPEDRLVYRIEKRPMKRPTWEPVSASLTIAGEDEYLLNSSSNRNMVYLNSNSTPEGGVTAEIVHIKSLEDFETTSVKGKIIFAEMRSYKLYGPAIAEGGALGIITYDNPSYLQPEKNTTSIQFRSIPYDENINAWGIALSYAAKEKLKAAMSEGPVKVKADIKTRIYPSEELTVVANVQGAELPGESLVFSAHIQEPGANDNATGVGTQLEMAMITANLISNNKLEAKRTLTFLWGDEIISTNRYIKEEEKRTSDINWGISLDMVGENTAVTGGSFLIEKMPDPSAIWTRGNDKHSEWGGVQLAPEDMKPHYLNDFIIDVFEAQGEYADWEVNTNPFEGGSDHTPFLRANIPGLLLWHFTDQFYHTDNDRIDKVSQETMTNVGVGALVSAYTLINANEETARQLIVSIVKAATDRLNTEAALSQAAITDGNAFDEEKVILETWNDWYQKTLESISDLTPAPNEKLEKEIAHAKNEVEELTKTLIQKLQ